MGEVKRFHCTASKPERHTRRRRFNQRDQALALFRTIGSTRYDGFPYLWGGYEAARQYGQGE
jgi:hypothetical protein